MSSAMKGWLVTGVLLPPLVWYGNPAVALLIGAALTLSLNRVLVEGGSRYGKLMLQTAIVLLGLRLGLDQVLTVSADSIELVIGFVLCVLAVGMLAGHLIGLDRISTVLLSGGTAICGGTAIATLAPILRAKPEQLAVAIAIVFLLNAVALLTFPAIGHWLDLSQTQFGVWAALAIHDTSSVVATAAIYGDEALEVATTVKLGRTLWLIPVALGVSLLVRNERVRVRVPGFILVFIGMAAVATFIDLPAIVTSTATTVSKALLVGALFFVGTEMTRATVAAIRGRILVHAVGLWLVAIAGTLTAVRWMI